MWDRLPYIGDDGNAYTASGVLIYDCSALNTSYDHDTRAIFVAEKLNTMIVSRLLHLEGGTPYNLPFMFVPLKPMCFFNVNARCPMLFSQTKPCLKNIVLYQQFIPMKDVDVLVVVTPRTLDIAMSRREIRMLQPWTTLDGKHQELRYTSNSVEQSYNFNPLTVKLDTCSKL